MIEASQHGGCATDICIIESTLTAISEVAQDTFLVRVDAPEIAAKAVPGQFVMLRLSGRDSPLIGRALAIYNIVDDAQHLPQSIELIFVRKGKFTTPLASAMVGTRVSLWGPLGNGFSDRRCDTLVMAAGGIGQTPMLILAMEALGQRRFGLPNRDGQPDRVGQPGRTTGWAKRVRFVYGARTAKLLACVEQFEQAGIEVELCTDDGSRGSNARVPQRLFELLDCESDLSQTRVVTCGPEIMMEKISQGCIDRGIDCQVSLETPMACGIGICFSCVAKVRIDQNGDSSAPDWDYRRTCTEGPIFDAAQLVW